MNTHVQVTAKHQRLLRFANHCHFMDYMNEVTPDTYTWNGVGVTRPTGKCQVTWSSSNIFHHRYFGAQRSDPSYKLTSGKLAIFICIGIFEDQRQVIPRIGWKRRIQHWQRPFILVPWKKSFQFCWLLISASLCGLFFGEGGWFFLWILNYQYLTVPTVLPQQKSAPWGFYRSKRCHL